MGGLLSILALAGLVLAVVLILILLSGIRVIPNNRIGIVEKRFSGKGSVKSGLIAMNGEAGYQPQVYGVEDEATSGTAVHLRSDGLPRS